MDVFSISRSQAYVLVRSGELPAIQVGGRCQWRVEVAQIEAYVQRQYRAGAKMANNSRDENGAGAGPDVGDAPDRPKGGPAGG